MTHVRTFTHRQLTAGAGALLAVVASVAVITASSPASADDPVTVSVSDASVAESDGLDDSKMYFTISLSGPTTETVTVNASTSNGTATAARPSDYSPRSHIVVSFPPGGVLKKRVQIRVKSDGTDEPDQTINFNLTSVTGATIDDGTGVGTIVDNDTAVISISNGSATDDRDGHAGHLFVYLSRPVQPGLTINYETADGTAISPDDYTAVAGSVGFSRPITRNQRINIPIQKDQLDEGSETFTVNLTGTSDDRFDVDGMHGTVTITDH